MFCGVSSISVFSLVHPLEKKIICVFACSCFLQGLHCWLDFKCSVGFFYRIAFSRIKNDFWHALGCHGISFLLLLFLIYYIFYSKSFPILHHFHRNGAFVDLTQRTIILQSFSLLFISHVAKIKIRIRDYWHLIKLQIKYDF